MKRFFRIFVLLVAVLAGWAAASQAATPKRVALVIGNANYAFAPLANPVNDARAMANKLKALGFEVVVRENMTQKQIGSTLREFRSKLSPGSEALFFYAGHGLQIKGVNYLPTVDSAISAEEDVPTQSLEVGKVLDIMEDAKTRLNLVFLDACRNNPHLRRFRSQEAGLAKMNAPSGTILSFATRPGSVAADGEGSHGLYTDHLLKAMEEPGLAIEQLLKKVLVAVKHASAGNQEPWTEGGIEGDFYFVPPSAQVTRTSASSAIELAFWQSIQSSQIGADFEEYLRRYPQGHFAGLARTRLQALTKSSPADGTAVPAGGTTGVRQNSGSSGNRGELEMARYGAVYNAGQGITATLLPAKNGKQVLLQITGVNHLLDGKVFLAKIHRPSETLETYAIKIDGQDLHLVSKGKRFGKDFNRLFLPGGAEHPLNYDEKLSRDLDIGAFVKQYEKQLRDGVKER